MLKNSEHNTMFQMEYSIYSEIHIFVKSTSWEALPSIGQKTAWTEKTKEESESLGVQLDFLLRKFAPLATETVRKEVDSNLEINKYGVVDPENPTFHAIAQSMMYGPNEAWSAVSAVCACSGARTSSSTMRRRASLIGGVSEKSVMAF